MNDPAGLSREMCDMIIQTLRQVVGRELPDEKILELDEKDEFPHDVVGKLLSPDVGMHLIFLPENVGGLGGGARDICRVSEEMAVIDLGLATAFLAICLGTDPILVGGTDEQKQKWLTRIAGEGLIVAYAVTEPEAGSNLAALQTTADPVVDAEGNVTGYRINGTKQFITNGGVAQLYTVLVRTPGGPSFFAVERDAPGLEPARHEDKHGIRASNTSGVVFEDVEVPLENLIGGVEGEGLKQAAAVFGYTRLMVGAFGLGGGQGALDRAIAYARTRIQFGTPLIDKEGYLAKILVEPWLDLAAGRAYVQQTALRIDSGAQDMGTEGAVAKYWCTEAGNRAAELAIQALGGYGYTREYMVEKMKRDVRITTIYEGTSEIQQSIIALYRWKETVRSKGAFYEELAAAQDAVHARNPEVGADIVAGVLRAVNDVVQHMHAARLTKNQVVMFALADMMTVAEVAGAFTEQAAAGEASSSSARAFAKRAWSEVREGARRCLTGLHAPGDEEKLSAALTVLERLEQRLPATATSGYWRDVAAVGAEIKEMD